MILCEIKRLMSYALSEQHPVYFKMLFFYKLTPSLTVEQIRNEAPLGIPFDLLIKSTKSYFNVHPKDEQTRLDTMYRISNDAT